VHERKETTQDEQLAVRLQRMEEQLVVRSMRLMEFFFFFKKRRDHMSNSDPGLNLLDKSLTFGGGIP
jgi:hypothetical protein